MRVESPGWLATFVFGVTGRLFAELELRVLDTIWTLTSYPDARLWNNRVGALAASSRSAPELGLAAGLASTEAAVFGGGPCLLAIDFFLRAEPQRRAGLTADAIVSDELRARGRILGYGRPIHSVDERLPPLMDLVRRSGLEQGAHYRLAFEVEEALVKHNPALKMNYASITAALAADLGFTARDFQLYNILMTFAGIPPCVVEAAEKPEGALMPVSCAHVAYEGPPCRRWAGSHTHPHPRTIP